MADMQDNDKMEEESYDLGGDEYTPEYEESGSDFEVEAEPNIDFGEDEPAPDMAMGERSPMAKRLMTIVGVVVGTAVIGGYLVYSERSNQLADQQGVPEPTQQSAISKLADAGKSEPEVAVPAEVKLPDSLRAATTTVETKPAIPVATQTSAPAPQMTKEQSEQLAQLAGQVRSNKLTLDNVEVKLETLQDSVKKGMTEMKAMLEKKMTVVKERVKPKKAYKPKKVVRRPPPPRDVFGLKAVVPGRAWIESSNGRSYTVTIGDRLPGLGRVSKIDAAFGRVVTSSGSVIIYGPGDF